MYAWRGEQVLKTEERLSSEVRRKKEEGNRRDRTRREKSETSRPLPSSFFLLPSSFFLASPATADPSSIPLTTFHLSVRRPGSLSPGYGRYPWRAVRHDCSPVHAGSVGSELRTLPTIRFRRTLDLTLDIRTITARGRSIDLRSLSTGGASRCSRGVTSNQRLFRSCER